MPASYRQAFDSYRNVIWRKKVPANLGESRLSNLREVLRRVVSLLADTDDDVIERTEVFWLGSMLVVAAVRDPDDSGEDMEFFAHLEELAIQAIVRKIHEWNGGVPVEEE